MKKKDLYIIQSYKTGAIKIGVSCDLKNRLRNIQTGCPYKIKVLLVLKDMGSIEKSLHSKLKKWSTRASGGEWFKYESLPSLPDWIYEQLPIEVMDSWWIDKE